MPSYRMFRMKEAPRQQFRWAPHTGGVAAARPKDYEEAGTVEAPSAYAVWFNLRYTDQALKVGDLLELPGGGLRIYKYVGFEEAAWVQLDVKPPADPPPLAEPPQAAPASSR